VVEKGRVPRPCVCTVEVRALEEVEDVEPVEVQRDTNTDLCDQHGENARQAADNEGQTHEKCAPVE